jgi:RHS repeat-associated protein
MPNMRNDPQTQDGNNKDSADKFLVQAPSLSLPKGGGAIRGIGEKFATNLVTGTGSLSIPIALSPGRSGFSPQLQLTYDSSGANGPFGFGWSLSVPTITRRTDRGLPRYFDEEDSDVFILSGSEDLVPVLELKGGAWVRKVEDRTWDGHAYRVHHYRPRIEGLFSRIERWTQQDDGDTYWRSISKDNVTTFYGKTIESRIADPADNSRVFSWLICQSYDDRGNAILYTYAAEDSSGVVPSAPQEYNRTPLSRSAGRYLKGIRYGNTPSRLVQPDLSQLSWCFEVVFDFGEGHYNPLPPDAQKREFALASPLPSTTWPLRKDPFSTFRAGFDVRTYRLCRRILVFHHFPNELGTPDYLVRTTELQYKELGIGSFITSVTQSGFVMQDDGTYLKKSLPPLELEYSEANVQQDVREVGATSLENLLGAVGVGRYRWLDLDGEGLQCVLAENEGDWYYKRNLSPLSFHFEAGEPKITAAFEPLAEVATLPAFANNASLQHQFLDLAGSGQLDCVVLDRPLAGYFERDDEDWDQFHSLPSVANIEWNDPNLRFIDIDGDGHADVLVTEDEVLTWRQSLAQEGFGPAVRVSKARDEEGGPAIVFADATQAVFLADMSGDGLTDIVRIRSGEICYWPNLGYGRFGRKIAMDNAPRLDELDQFDESRVRLADIDGSGTTDLIYLGRNRTRLYFNQSGNRWSDAETLDTFPQVDDLRSMQAVDLLGNGTSCLVWTSSSPADARRSMRYVDLMGGQKPHLLLHSRNNMGAETRLFYAPSTKFYLADRAAGNPWVTRLPFPVQVVERVETYDYVSRNRFVTRYRYHHGFFDGVEREFRGFGMVEQIDTEELAVLTASGVFPSAENIDAASYVPPVLTKTWFHTGAYLKGERISKYLEHEYWQEPESSELLLLPDTVLPPDLQGDEFREACRALKAMLLRQEVYALDGTDEADRPYSVSERNYTVRFLQPIGPNQHAVFFAHACETIDFHYERMVYPAGARMLPDPRTAHGMVLAVDDFGNELQSVAISYGRRRDDPDPLLTATDRERQRRTHITYREAAYTNPILELDDYRPPLPAETRTYELIKVTPDRNVPDITNLFLFDEVRSKVALAADGLHDIPYEDIAASGAVKNVPYRRLIEHVRALYRKNDLTGALPLRQLESLALPFESYKLALTPGLLSVFQRGGVNLLPAPVNILRDEGGYVLSDDRKAGGLFPASDADGNWWIPGGQMFCSINPLATAVQELAEARSHFFYSRRTRDPFGADTKITYDAYDLLILEIEDAVGNRITTGERGLAIVNRNDYRVLQPSLITDANGNRAAAAFDALGLVTGTAVMGKNTESLGDSLAAFQADLTQAETDLFFTDPTGPAGGTLLDNASTRVVYDVGRYSSGGAAHPVYAATIVRETHVSDEGGIPSRRRVTFSYSDGFGREIQRKIPAEPGPLADGGPVVNPRWVASGWTIFNNKGKPVRQFEPFFDDTHEFRFGNTVGVSPTISYDPIGRSVVTLLPNHSWGKVVFEPWRQEAWDMNDTVLLDPATDADAARYFARIPGAQYLPTWHDLRSGGVLGAEEQDAAAKAAAHAATPARTFCDTLGRPFLTVADNGGAKQFETRVDLDIQGNQRSITDPLLRVIVAYDYDMLGTKLHEDSADRGERWLLNDVTGKAIRAWDSRDHQFRTQYDSLRRPTRFLVATGAAPEKLAAFIVYGEGQVNDVLLNLRGKLFQHFDGAGVASMVRYDFKGNPLEATRRLLHNYKDEVDWATAPALEAELFTSSTTYDALNRATSTTAPDGSVIRPEYNEANLLERIRVNLRGSALATPFVTNVDYSAKGQRLRIDYRNGTTTTYSYDRLTFRLAQLRTVRSADNTVLQDLAYCYDPIGNITSVLDTAQQSVYFNNAVVTPDSRFVYDPLYRLISAEGREHIGQLAEPQTIWDDQFRVNQPHPNDGNAMRKYKETYAYDAVGNISQVVHTATAGNWSRTYAYGAANNRLAGTTVGAVTDSYTYDTHGNMVSMPHLPSMQENFKDELQVTQRQVVNGGPGEKTYYVYDAGGQRTRKVTERANGSRRSERIYLGAFELYREYAGDGSTMTLERETLHVTDDKERVALIETRTQGADGSPDQLQRFQYSNHVGSAMLELDEGATPISYEEYYPYGSTSYQAVNKPLKAAAKRYRYTGKERDEETGLYYYGARYYAPWLARWTACDPSGFVDGTNLYAYARNNPIRLRDATGRQSTGDVPVIRLNLTEEEQHNLEENAKVFAQTEKAFEEDANRRARAPKPTSEPAPKPAPNPAPTQPPAVAASNQGSQASSTGVGFYREPVPGDIIRPVAVNDTGSTALNIPVNAWLTLSNMVAAVINTAGNLEYQGERGLKAMNFSDTDIEAAKDLALVGEMGSLVAGMRQARIANAEVFGEFLKASNVVSAETVAGLAQGADWESRVPGVQLAKSEGWWMKRVDPNASLLMRWWGESSVKAQSEALDKLGGLATPHVYVNGTVYTKDVGQVLPGSLRLLDPLSRKTYVQGSLQMGWTFFNDIQPRNMGANGLVFDPAIDPVIKTLFWGGMGAIGAGVGYTVSR